MSNSSEVALNLKPGNIAIIGGTGFEKLPPEIFAEEIKVTTDYGEVTLLSISDNYIEPFSLYFLSRHGPEHKVAPHDINYKANCAALKILGVEYVVACNAVGSLRKEILPGSFVLLDDFIDFTRSREITYFGSTDWHHTDFTIPYSRSVQSALRHAVLSTRGDAVPVVTYLCCDGPRFETPAEIRLFANWGADVVGMTGVPEVVFANECNMQYAALAVVTNLGAGLSADAISHEDVSSLMAAQLNDLREILLMAARKIRTEFVIAE